MDLTDPVHPDCAPSMSYQTPVSAPLHQIQHLPAYMHVPARDRTSTGQGLGHLMNFSSPPIPSQIHNSSTVPSLQSFSSLHMIPQSASETWHHHVPTNHYTTSQPLPPAPTNSINNLMNNTYTPIVSPPIPLFNYLQSPVLVPPALTCTPSCMGSPHLIDHVPSRIVHQPQPHQIVDLDCPMHPPTEQQYPLYYANPPYPFPYTLPPESSHSDTPRFKIEYSSIHSMFLATIKDLDSLKDRKSWVKWNEGVWQAVANGFVLGHICDKPPLGSP
ncbi:hypothetical protein EV368DRAFT_77709 [Lentinula lateritia]|nr:hypothetical protein EV368DRAFT_77709 [Lentinula lateritia]